MGMDMSLDVDQIATLLRDSMTCHMGARTARRMRDSVAALGNLQEALTLREQAHALDPEHMAPAWAEEQRHSPNGKDTHTEMLAFYRQQLEPGA